MKTVTWVLNAGLGFVLAVSQAQAALVTYAFTGTIAGPDYPGETLNGTFSYDTTTPGFGVYPIPDSMPFQFSIGLVRTGLTAFVGNITILDEQLSGNDRLLLGGPLPPGGVFPTGFTLSLDMADSTHTAFNSNALTATLPPASAFDTKTFQIREFIQGIQILSASGNITSLRLVTTDVPEPSTILLLGAGCAALLRKRRQY